MKKLFVSVPTKGRTEEAIKASVMKMKKIAEVIFDQEFELIKSIWDADLEYDDIAGLARHIDCMKDADYFVGVNNIYDKYCDFESMIASRYDLDATFLNAREVCPDMFDGKNPRVGEVRGSWDFS